HVLPRDHTVFHRLVPSRHQVPGQFQQHGKPSQPSRPRSAVEIGTPPATAIGGPIRKPETTIPYICGRIAMVGWGLLSDRMNERRSHLLVACTVSTIGLVIAGMTMGTWW